MTVDPREGLSAALGQAGSEAALTALRSAIARAAGSLSEEVGKDDDFLALQCVIGLGETLPDLERLLGLVPGLVMIASPGRPVEERIAVFQARLDEQVSELAATRAALTAAGDIERRLAEMQAERDELQTQADMLERQQQIAEDLPYLQAKLEQVREATDEATAGPVEQLAHGLVQAVRHLADLTDEQRSRVGAELARLMKETVSAGTALAAENERLDALKAELAAHRAEADELQHEYQRVLPDLQLYCQVDQELADALAVAGMTSGESPLERVRGSLAEIMQQLCDVDGMLKPLLDAQASAYADARRIRNWSSQG